MKKGMKMKEGIKMNEEEIMNEVKRSASPLNMDEEEVLVKFEEICTENGCEMSDMTGLALWRQFAGQVIRKNKKPSGGNTGGSGNLAKTAFGFFVSLEAPRDTMAWNRNKAIENYKRDADEAFMGGMVAIANETGDGRWAISAMLNEEKKDKIINNLPAGAVETDEGDTIIPLDTQENFMSGAKNKAFGKPLPKEEYKRLGVFYGEVEGAEAKPYFFSYKKEGCMEFAPNCFEWLAMTVIPSEDGSTLYGFTKTTKASLVMNVDADPESDDFKDMSNTSFVGVIEQHFTDKVVALVDIDRQHLDNQSLSGRERYIITDGTVCNMNMQPFSNGNRIINITDLTSEFDYENESNMTTCWVPEHINIDFGIGSRVIMIGRTSQRMGDDGPEPSTINVSGIYVLESCGSPVEYSAEDDKELDDWFE